MSIAVDQTRLRKIVTTLLGCSTLTRNDGETILEIAQLAAGIEPEEDPAEHATLQAIAQQVGALVGFKPGELQPIPEIPDEDARRAYLRALARQLSTQTTRELAYTLAFLVSVADLRLTPEEHTNLELFQHALGVDYSRATDLAIFASEIVAADDTAA